MLVYQIFATPLLSVERGRVQIGISAPAEVTVVRQELLERKGTEQGVWRIRKLANWAGCNGSTPSYTYDAVDGMTGGGMRPASI